VNIDVKVFAVFALEHFGFKRVAIKRVAIKRVVTRREWRFETYSVDFALDVITFLTGKIMRTAMRAYGFHCNK
jgi:hypothetical protein